MRWVTTVYTHSVSSNSPSMSNKTCETGAPCFPAAADIKGSGEEREKDADGVKKLDEASRKYTSALALLMHRLVGSRGTAANPQPPD